MEWLKKIFGDLYAQLKAYLKEEILKLAGSLAENLKDANKLYWDLKVEERVMGLLSSIDKTPLDKSDLKLLPWVPGWLQRRVVKFILRKLFVFAVQEFRMELLEIK